MEPNQLLVFSLDSQRYALPLAAVERVVRMVEITSLPKAPDIVMGVVNLRGDLIPVVNIRKRFELPEREANLSNHLIFARTPQCRVAFMADSVSGVVEVSPEQIVGHESIVRGIEYITGVVKLSDGMVLIHDLSTFLSLEETQALDHAMNSAGHD